jgi:hypothetical protein
VNTQDESAASDVSEQTEPIAGAEQTESESKPTSFADALLKAAKEEGHTIGDEPEPAETEPEGELLEPKTEDETPETEIAPAIKEETEEPEEEEKAELKPAAKKGDEWPESAKVRVAEEAAKRRRAIDRADKAEALAQQLQEQLAQAVAPRPTEDNRFIDVQDITRLDSIERELEKSLDLADENPNALVEKVVELEKEKSGVDLLEKYTPEQILAFTKRKAEKAIRKEIPERRTYLQQRADADAAATSVYPELRDPESELTKVAATLAYRILTGQAQKDPNLLIYCAHAAKQYLMSQQRNGHEKTAEVKTPEAKQILQSARQKVAPTPTRTRSFTERRGGSADLEKASKKLEERGDAESAEELVNAIFSKRETGTRRLEPIAE